MEALTACSVRIGVGGSAPTFSFPSRRRSFGGRSLFIPTLRASSKDGPELDKWDQMELKFGRLLGEDPKLTLAKIMARKSNPDVSYLDVEKAFRKNKGKLDDYMINIPSDVKMEDMPSAPLKKDNTSDQKVAQNVMDGKINLSRPMMNRGIEAMRSTEKSIMIQTQKSQIVGNIVDKNVPNVSLRKPSITQDDDIEMNSKFKTKPNILFQMRKKSSEDLCNVPLLKKPEVAQISLDSEQETVTSGDSFQSSPTEMGVPDNDAKVLNEGMKVLNDTNLIEPTVNSNELQPRISDESSSTTTPVEDDVVEGQLENKIDMNSTSSKIDYGLVAELQPPKESAAEDSVVKSSSTNLDHGSPDSMSNQSFLLGKPQRLDSSTKGTSQSNRNEKVPLQHHGHDFSAGTESVMSVNQEEIEESDWRRAEHLLQSGEKAEVELISCSSRGFVASLGSLVGFLPYRYLGTKWKFLAFESWLKKKGINPSLYRQNLSILGNYNLSNTDIDMESTLSQEPKMKAEESTSNLKYEELLEAYDQEKTKFLSSFVDQRLTVSVILADRNSRKIMFSGRPKEKEESVEKKRNLMARLSIGDVVKCCIKKITYFGIFVEVEGVPALIHQSEVPWDATLDPSSYFKIGMIVEAKVHQLDYTLERIMLSLRDITPDPLMEALESVVGDRASLDGKLEASQADVEWAEVDSLVKELQKINGVSSVSRGRFFISPGLTPTFQVYMASILDNKYKLLARYENKVQEVMVESSLDKEQMKAAILTCTNRVT
ncbi:hypothetical protein Cni_G03564 [Canna indica]|uniref:S1 motif domain-containing protein n=1 Tax=Canna indica TaxID=4628 RepID=A0AAQ3JTR1_9LILI|nr:hypothetical protein Cni_G03564 [Canna indica]